MEDTRTHTGWWLARAIAITVTGCQAERAPLEMADSFPDESSFRMGLTDLDDELQLHYNGANLCVWECEPFCVLSCSLLDLSGHGRSGLMHGATTVSSPWGQAVSFDGVDDWIEIFDDGDLTNPATFGGSGGAFTISARVRVDDADKYNRLCYGCGPISGMHVGHATYPRRVTARVRDVVDNENHIHVSDDLLLEDTWMQVTMIVDATGPFATRYQFDCERGEAVTLEPAPDPYVPLFRWSIDDPDVGLHDYGTSSIANGNIGSGWFRGEIDDLRIWSRALSEDELAMLCTDPADPPCTGVDTNGDPLEIDPPAPPTAYGMGVLPTCNGTTVQCVGGAMNTPAENAEELQDAIAGGVAEDIVLADGLYDHAGLYTGGVPWQNGEYLRIMGHRLWAANVGEAVLNFGIDTSGVGTAFSNPELHGLKFDITSTTHTPAVPAGACDLDGAGGDDPTTNTNTTAAFLTWNGATNAVVEDCTFDGNGVIGSAITAGAHEGLHVARVEMSDFARYGILAGNQGLPPLTSPMVIQDVTIDRIGDPNCWTTQCSLTDPGCESVECTSCGFYPGTAEHGMQLGDYADVDRIRIRDVRAAGINNVGNTDGTTLDHLDIDRVGVGHDIMGGGIAFERTTRNTTVANFCIGPLTRIGVGSEWDHCGLDEQTGPRGIGNTVMNGHIQSWLFGVSYDQGTVDGTVSEVVLSDYHRAGIVMYHNQSTEPSEEDGCPVVPGSYDDGGTQVSNVFLEPENEGAGICDFTRSPTNSTMPACE